MRCQFIRDGRAFAAEEVTAASDAEAIGLGIERYRERLRLWAEPLDDFELWDRDRLVYRFPAHVKAPA